MVQLSLRWLRLAAGNLLLVLSVLVFAKAFFPYKPFLQGLAQHADYHDGEDTPAPAQFEKIVFMLVDALRRYISGPTRIVIVRYIDIWALTSSTRTIAISCLENIQDLSTLKGGDILLHHF